MSLWDVLKKDLAEFVTVVKSDAEVAVAAVVKSEVREEKKRNVALSDTYTEQLSGADLSEFNKFSATFDILSKTNEIATLLRDDQEIRNLHALLVPVTLSYQNFWQRCLV